MLEVFARVCRIVVVILVTERHVVEKEKQRKVNLEFEHHVTEKTAGETKEIAAEPKEKKQRRNTFGRFGGVVGVYLRQLGAHPADERNRAEKIGHLRYQSAIHGKLLGVGICVIRELVSMIGFSNSELLTSCTG